MEFWSANAAMFFNASGKLIVALANENSITNADVSCKFEVIVEPKLKNFKSVISSLIDKLEQFKQQI